jgi:orotate phosphoribosyltransferase
MNIIGKGLGSREKIEKAFLDVLIKGGALKIARNIDELFTLKSRRTSAYFINIGALTDGWSISRIKSIFADYIFLLKEEGKIKDFDFVFGPAYKGINLAVLTCEGLNELHGINKRYMYDRKEEKVYGDVAAEKIIVGSGYFVQNQKILLVDDVITTGCTKLEALEKLRFLGEHEVVGLVLAVDRQEKMGNAIKVEDKSAIDHIWDEFGIRTFPILNAKTIFNLVEGSLSREIKRRWVTYYEKYGSVELC